MTRTIIDVGAGYIETLPSVQFMRLIFCLAPDECPAQDIATPGLASKCGIVDCPDLRVFTLRIDPQNPAIVFNSAQIPAYFAATLDSSA